MSGAIYPPINERGSHATDDGDAHHAVRGDCCQEGACHSHLDIRCCDAGAIHQRLEITDISPLQGSICVDGISAFHILHLGEYGAVICAAWTGPTVAMAGFWGRRSAASGPLWKLSSLPRPAPSEGRLAPATPQVPGQPLTNTEPQKLSSPLYPLNSACSVLR